MKNKLELKQLLYQHCLGFIENRFLTLQNTIKEIQESLLSETKSSAGDKHETGRAMLQLEREKAGNQISEINKVKETLLKIEVNKVSKNICLGSVVFTNEANYFIAISAGQFSVGAASFYAISPNTPMGQSLMSKVIGDEVIFREKPFKILEII